MVGVLRSRGSTLDLDHCVLHGLLALLGTWAVLLLLTGRLVFGASNGNYKGGSCLSPLPNQTFVIPPNDGCNIVGREIRGNYGVFPTHHSKSPLGENVLGQDSLVHAIALNYTSVAYCHYLHGNAPSMGGTGIEPVTTRL